MEKEEIIKRANDLLEKTKNNIEKYQEERKTLFNYMEKIDEINIDVLEKYLNLFEKYFYLQENIIKVDELKEIIKELANQQNRKYENNDKIKVFKLVDKNGKEYTFLSRKNMSDYLKQNQEKFDYDVQIELKENTNIDLERILKLLEKIF